MLFNRILNLVKHYFTLAIGAEGYIVASVTRGVVCWVYGDVFIISCYLPAHLCNPISAISAITLRVVSISYKIGWNVTASYGLRVDAVINNILRDDCFYLLVFYILGEVLFTSVHSGVGYKSKIFDFFVIGCIIIKYLVSDSVQIKFRVYFLQILKLGGFERRQTYTGVA